MTKSSNVKSESPSNAGDQPTVTVKVDGLGKIDAQIHTSKTSCVILKSVLTKAIASKIQPLKIKTAVGLLGSVNLQVTYLDKAVEVTFLVFHHLPSNCPVILGLHWIQRSRATLRSDGKRLRVTFSKKKEKNQRPQQLSASCPHVPVKVDGIKGVIPALVDTGCQKSAIRENLLTDQQMAMAKGVPSYIMEDIANGAKVNKLGVVNLNVTYKEKTASIETVEITLKQHEPLILGMDWFHRSRAVIKSDGSDISVSIEKTKRKRFTEWMSRKWNSTIRFFDPKKNKH